MAGWAFVLDSPCLRWQARRLTWRDMDWLGKRLYRGAPRHERRRKLGALIASLVVGVVIAVVLGLVFYWIDVRSPH